MNLSFDHLPTNGIILHTAMAGLKEGKPVFLLHGFPDTWFGWEAQIEPLAEAGFRVIVPDQRGYNLSDKPKGISSYRMKTLIEDIIGLADTLGYDQFSLAGHDFGAMVGWNLAMYYPARLERVAIANVPHPVVMQKFIRTNLSQMRKSWYAFFFQLPYIPEWILKANNWQALTSALPEKLTEKERSRYRQAWAQPGAMTGMINWYRAIWRHPRRLMTASPIEVLTLVIWGQQDRHISYEMAQLSVNTCATGRLVTFEDASHWVMRDKSKEVSKLLIDHFS
jgi:pimeloyl-ACP methyl ester carboxylesterase